MFAKYKPDKYTKYDDYNTSDIYAPTLLVIKDGEVLLYDDSTAIRSGNYTPDIYWQDYQIEEFKSTLRLVFEKYVKEDSKWKKKRMEELDL